MSQKVARLAVALIAFLTLVDLFGAQAILPTLARHYGTSPGTMGVAVNACALGMAIACFVVGAFSKQVDRRIGIVSSLLALSVPTALLAHAPDLASFAALRVAQGLCMATAFTLTLAHLGERYEAMAATTASAAYITGNVASNLLGRLLSAAVADHAGLAWTFYAFAALNVAGALMALSFVTATMSDGTKAAPAPGSGGVRRWLGDRQLAVTDAIGFCILFAFIGTFTYVNFVLMRPPLALNQMQLGFVYFVFLPSIFTTPQAGAVVGRFGRTRALVGSLALAVFGLALLLLPSVPLVLVGLALVAIGTFLAQAAATGIVSMAMGIDRGTASGFYLGSYFLGGLAGAAVLGALFDAYGWTACVAGIAAALTVAGLLALRLK